MTAGTTTTATATAAATVPGLAGLAGRISEALGRSLTVAELYGPLGGPVYHELTATDVNEVRDLLAVLRGRRGPVLELACGSGRLTVPLLTAGHQVTGVDTSRSLLSTLRARMADPAAERLACRLELVEADMCALGLDRTFDAAVLGTTTIGLVPPEVRPDFFRRVRDHLRPEGLFALSAHLPEEAPGASAAGGSAGPADTVRPLVTGGAVHFVIERSDGARERRHVSVFRVAAEGQPLLLHSTVHVPRPETLVAELDDAGFTVDTVRPARATTAALTDLSIIVARRNG
ncbi:daptide-type RiPP biosynthesis methyltransferase [Streptomyces sp. NPDC050600]|uniref:daptide-type RiPP biosynthesis methyltransferase n=1 Tax=Streptomyces sp. NPDC050600 TaxID=3157213 RepID=UPI00342701EA